MIDDLLAKISALVNWPPSVAGFGASLLAFLQSLATTITALYNAILTKAPGVHLHEGITGPPILSRGTTADRLPSGNTMHMRSDLVGHAELLKDGAVEGVVATREWFAPRYIPALQQDDYDPWVADADWGLPKGPSGLAAWGWADFSPWLAGLAWRVSLRAMLATSRSTTNKTLGNNFAPTTTSNLVKAGDQAATLTVVDDSAALAAAGLSWLCSNGKVYKVDNSAGTAACQVAINGPVGNTNAHSLSMWYRSAQATCVLYWGNSGSGISGALPAAAGYARAKRANQTPPASHVGFGISVPAGATLHFILAQLEEGATCTHEVRVNGAAATSGPLLSLNIAYQVNPASTPVRSRWQPSTVYGLGDLVIPLTPNGYRYICTVGGATAATPPTWPTTVGATVADGGVTWQCEGAGPKHLGSITVMPTAALSPTLIDTAALQIPAGEAAVGDVVLLAVWRPAGAAHDDALIQAVWPYPVEV